MKRKQFIRHTALGVAGLAAGKAAAQSTDKQPDLVGFNHLPTKEERTMKSVIHRAETRGHANHGWLDTHHTFSFASYYNPERMHFGVLRVLNDDIVEGGHGFSTHPHDNMEIISIPLEGDLEHKDSMGNTMVIRKNDVQIMSAGSGVRHSEKNRNRDQKVNFLQIWVFPKEKNITPQYDQKTYLPQDRQDRWQRIVSPKEDEAVTIHQDAYFSLGRISAGTTLPYALQRLGHGVYAFVIDGAVTIGEATLQRRDGMGLWDMESLEVQAQTDAEVLLMEVPMTLGG